MQTTVRMRTDTDLAARRVARRVLGDLLSIHEKFGMSTVGELTNLAHDIQVGLAHDCVDRLTLYLYERGTIKPKRVYIYARAAPGSFAVSDHSGRIARDSGLVGGQLVYIVNPRDRGTWDQLKREGKFSIAWSPSSAPGTAGMTPSDDGGYASGTVGLSRTCLTRPGV